MQQATDLYKPDFHVQYISGRKITCSPQWKISGYILPFNKLYLVTSGGMIAEMDGKTYHLRRGDMILIPRGKKHSLRHTEKKHLEKLYMHFTLELAGGINFFDTPDFLAGSPVVSFHGDFDEIVKTFSAIGTNCERKNRLAVLTQLNAACLSVVSSYIDKKLSEETEGSAVFAEVLSAMHTHPGGLSLQTLADMVFLSPEHFTRKFKSVFGVPPMKYYDRIRIDFATAAIREENLSFREIAEKLGITDLCYFSKFFRKHVGISPSEYRSTCHKQDIMFAEGSMPEHI